MSGKLSSTTVKLDEAPDLGALLPSEGGVIWLAEATSLVASGPCLRIEVGAGAGRFERAAELFRQLLEGAEIRDEVDLPGTGPVLFGSWTFDPDAEGSVVLIPSLVFGSSEGLSWRTEVEFDAALAPAHLPLGGRADDTSVEEWMDGVECALDEISQSAFEKVVLARQVTVSGAAPYDQPALTRLLRETYPGCFTFGFQDLVGASPELLIRRVGDVVDSIPLAGSAPRGRTDEQDAAIGRNLFESAKNRTEHALTVSSVTERLQPYCYELVAEPEPSLMLLANLQHLSTKVQGRLKRNASAIELAGALHPTAAVCGVPQEAALHFIRNAETFERGRYAGPIGWMDRHGDGEWALALRCALIEGRTARVFAGAGIVGDSVPAEELEETRLKLQAMLDVLGREDATGAQST
ncbi:MAG: isochorismate synthase [Actinomycetota bacterium]